MPQKKLNTFCTSVPLQENLLLEKDKFRKKVEEGLEEYIQVLGSSVRHVQSFEKYKARLREGEIEIPADVEEAIRNYLRADWRRGVGVAISSF
jgi:vacuolar-type H+-ATPase subunit E/Vma4